MLTDLHRTPTDGPAGRIDRQDFNCRSDWIYSETRVGGLGVEGGDGINLLENADSFVILGHNIAVRKGYDCPAREVKASLGRSFFIRLAPDDILSLGSMGWQGICLSPQRSPATDRCTAIRKDHTMVDQAIILIVLLLLSGFFSSAETALFSISRTKARHLAKVPGRANALIKQMKDDPHRLLSTILIGNNVVNVAASAIATRLAIDLFHSYAIGSGQSFAIGAVTGVMTFLILVFGEVIPKSTATRNSVLIARMVIHPIYWCSILFRPVVLFLDFIPKITGKIKKTPSVTEEELMTFVEAVEEEGEIKEQEKELIHNIFEFDDTNASEIMTPRADMFVIEADGPLDLKTIAESGFTRIPVIEESIDNVVGILNVKDLLAYQAKGETISDVRRVMRPPYFVPEHKKLDSLLGQFKKRKTHMAIVVDEHGGVSGLITLEDALEELVGEIRDETDKEESLIIRLKNKDWVVMGKTDIDEVNETIGMNIPDSANYDTFSGYVLEKIGRIPSENEKFTIGDFEITVKSKDGNRIREYIVRAVAIVGTESQTPNTAASVEK
jgi:magnesium and cobalt exporter, CNNM family